jgi:type IV pilus assembly protein PilV
MSDAPRHANAHRCGGFSLVEVMVALVVCAIGMLGLAKMESLSISSTSVASSRALAAIQAQSLAATMHANTGYWASGTAPATTTVTVANGTTTINSTDPSLSTVVAGCSATGTASCAPNVMAAYDLQQWAQALQTLLPGSFATITCTTTDLTPVTCTVQIQWTEKAVAANVQQTNLNTLQLPTYTLYVQP